MLRIIETFNHLPQSFYVDSGSKFEPGQIGSLKIKNGKTIVTICDGINPIGILDDIKNDFYRVPIYNKQLVVPVSNYRIENYLMILSEDLKFELDHTNIIHGSFKSSIPVILDSKKGVITIPRGTQLDDYYFKSKGILAVIFNINYAFKIKAKSFDDSTISTEQATVWNKLLIADTNMFDTAVEYRKYDNLYADNGLLTTKKLTYEAECIGFVLDIPTNDNPLLRFLFDPNNQIKIGGKNG